MKNNVRTSTKSYMFIFFVYEKKSRNSYTKPLKLHTKLTIVYKVLHSYTNLKHRILKFIYGFWAGILSANKTLFM